MYIEISILCILFLLSALFSAAETAFTSLSPVQVSRLIHKGGFLGHLIASLTKKPETLLTTVLVGNNIVNISITALFTSMVIRLGAEAYIGYTTGFLTLFVLLFAEVTPKQIAILHNEMVCSFTAPLLWFSSWLFKPIVWVITLMSSLFAKILSPHTTSRERMSLDHLMHAIALSESLGIIQNKDTKLFQNVFRINDLPVQNVLTHRRDVFSLEGDMTIHEALPLALERAFTRIPLYSGNPENIVGVVILPNLTKLSREGKGKDRLKDHAELPLFVPNTYKLDTLFQEFKQKAANLAIVLDEYGGLAGIVTREDILEELFGEMYDETDEDQDEKIESLGKNTWRIPGDSNFHLIEEEIGITLDHGKRTQTISGYLMEKIDQIPSPGDRINLEEGSYLIEKIYNNRIESILFSIPQENEPADLSK